MTTGRDFDQQNLRRFFIITFVFSWLIWGMGVVLSYASKTDLSFWIVFPIIIIGAFGPFAGSVWCTYKNEGRAGVKKFLKRGVQIKGIPKIVWSALFLIPILAMLIAIGIVNITYSEGGLSLIGLLILPLYIVTMYLGGPLQEEYGWRGFALDRLQVKWNALLSSIILGFSWAAWHLPLFFIDGSPQQQLDMGLFFIGTIMLAIIMTWLHNNSKGNIFVAMTFHSVSNAAIIIVDTEDVSQTALKAGEAINLIVLMVIALLIIIIWGPKTLTKAKPNIIS